jgi:hypothetical protein
MSLITFIWKTDKWLFVPNGMLFFGIFWCLQQGEPTSAVIAGIFFFVVLIGTLVGKSIHRQRLVVEGLKKWISTVSHNGELGHKPYHTQKQALQYVNDVLKDPTAGW